MDLDSSLKDKYDIKDLQKFRKNIISNIQNVKDYYNPHFYCFQEITNDSYITKLFDKKIFKHIINNSGLEFMLTIWNNIKYKLIKYIPGEFEKGRPFCILILLDVKTNNKFVLINLHAGHLPNTYDSIFKHIQKIIDDNKEEFLFVSRIIIAGDYNRDINNEFKKNVKLNLKIDKKFNFKFDNKKTYNTCCDIQGIKLSKNFDHVIDTYHKNIIKYELNKESWYRIPSSDHVMIMTVLKHF
jgi:hypothetical protein